MIVQKTCLPHVKFTREKSTGSRESDLFICKFNYILFAYYDVIIK